MAPVLDPERWRADHRPALHAGGRTWSYADVARDLGDAIARIAGATTPGDAVAILAVDDGPTLISFCAVMAAGRLAVPVDPRDPADRARHAIDLTRPTLLLRAGNLPSGAPDLSWRPLADLPASGPADVADVTGATPAVVFFTSGTTGRPRGCVRTHDQIARVAADNADLQQLGAHSHFAFTFPLAFQGGITCALAALDRGAAVTLLDPATLGVDGIVAALTDPTLTNVGAVPSILRRVAQRCTEQGRTLPNVAVVGVGGEPVDDTDVTLVRAAMPAAAFRNFYGTQESGTIAASWIPPDETVPPGPLPAGTLRPGLTLAVVDEAGDPVPTGTVGEVATTGPVVATDYLGDPAGSAARRVTIDGVVGMRTGDLGLLDPAGVLHVVGRATHRIKVLGAAVDLLEVEAALRSMPDVASACVSAVPDERSGNRLVAHVVPTGTSRPGAAGLRDALAGTLAPAMIPRRVCVYDALPHTTRDKVDRHTLDALAASPTEPMRTLGPRLTALGPTVAGRPTVLLVASATTPLGPLLPLTVDAPAGPAVADVVVVRAGTGLGASRRHRTAVARLRAAGIDPVAELVLPPVPDVAAVRAGIVAALGPVRPSSSPDPADRP